MPHPHLAVETSPAGYRRACAAGLADEAREHAHRCLEIDPGCFMKMAR